MAGKLILKETETSIILEIPKKLLRLEGRAFGVNDLLSLVEVGRREYKSGKTRVFSSIKELLPVHD